MHTLNTIFSSNPEKFQNSSIKASEGIKHAIMRNGDCTSNFKDNSLIKIQEKGLYLSISSILQQIGRVNLHNAVAYGKLI